MVHYIVFDWLLAVISVYDSWEISKDSIVLTLNYCTKECWAGRRVLRHDTVDIQLYECVGLMLGRETSLETRYRRHSAV